MFLFVFFLEIKKKYLYLKLSWVNKCFNYRLRNINFFLNN